MGKQKKQKVNKKNIINFEMENSEEIEELNFEETKKENDVQEKKINDVIVNDVEAGDFLIDDERNGEDIVSVKPLAKNKLNSKIDMYIEFVLIFVLGALIGVALKTEAGKRTAIGFNDYQMKIVQQDFDINKIQFELTKRDMEESKKVNKSSEEVPIEEGENSNEKNN